MADQATAAAPAAAAPASGAPSVWGGAFDAYKYSKAAVMKNIGPVIVLLLISAFAGGLVSALLKGNQFGSIFNLLVASFTVPASAYVYLEGVRGKEVEIGEAFNKGVQYYFRTLLLHILVGLTLVVSLLLLVIPFFFVLPRVVLSYYFMVDQDMGVMDAYKASWDATKGNSMKVWGIIGVNILMALLMITIIGIPFAIYFLVMYSAAYAVLYVYLHKKQPVAAKAQAQPAAAV
jgi:uncharacterized membrane protein